MRSPILLTVLLAAFVTLTLLSGCSGGRTTASGRVAGIVLTDTALPVVGATVRVQGTSLTTVTGADGGFHLARVPLGPQTIIIAQHGFETAKVPVTVQENIVARLPDTILIPVSRVWTVMVYMNADNDLEGFGVQDVNEMESVPASDDVTVVVQMDRIPGYDFSNGNWAGTKRFVIQHDTDPLLMTSALDAEDLGELDMGNPATLRNFIAWSKEQYPAERYLLVVWNHGAGWRSRTTEPTRGVSFDDTSGTFIRTVDLPAALATTPPLDIVAFDASLMQMLEVVYEIRNNCEYVVGSEESPPGAGYAYHTWLGPLVANPRMSPRELAITMARETLTYYGRNSDITHSVIETAQVPQLATAVDAFAGVLIANAQSQAAVLAAARDQAERFKYPEYKDLYHYAELVKAKTTRSDLRAAAGAVMSAVQRAVVDEYHGDAHPHAHGVSIFIPTPSAYPRLATLYVPLALSRHTRWDEWLGAQVQ